MCTCTCMRMRMRMFRLTQTHAPSYAHASSAPTDPWTCACTCVCACLQCTHRPVGVCGYMDMHMYICAHPHGHVHVQVVLSGDDLFSMGSVPHAYYLLQTGELQMVAPERQRRGSTVNTFQSRIVTRGSLIGFQDLRVAAVPYQYSVKALMRSSLLSLTRAHLTHVLELMVDTADAQMIIETASQHAEVRGRTDLA